MKKIVVFLKTEFSKLNFFNTGSENEQIIQGERRTTRVYLILLIASIGILTFYYSVIPFDETIHISTPTLTQYTTLSKKFSLECPCSKISVKYKEFIDVQPIYHELCQSDFISAEWMKKMLVLYDRSWNNSAMTDYRRIALFQFQTLRSLCELSKENVINGLRSFQEKDFLQSKFINDDIFHSEIDTSLNEFIASSSATFGRILKFVQSISAQSLIMTGGPMTSVYPNNQMSLMFEQANIQYPGNNYTFSDGSSCICTSVTATTCVGPSTLEEQNIPGLLTGCYMMNALFKSSLEPLYNQSLINMLTNSTNEFHKLNFSDSRTTVDILLQKMLVESWSTNKFHEQYFNHCRPDFCRYTLSRRYGIFQIITLIIGLFGGLSTSWKIIAPILVNRIWPMIKKNWNRNRIRHHPMIVAQASENNGQLRSILSSIQQTIFNLNLYESIPRSHDEQILRHQRYSTRVYLVMLGISFCLLTLFTSVRMQTITRIIPAPTITDFIQLFDQYEQILACPCSQTTIKYDQIFLQLKPEYDQICSSAFVSSNWINLQFKRTGYPYRFLHDIRFQSQMHFQLLSTLCQNAALTIDDNLKSFYESTLISHQVLDRQSFQFQTNLIVEQFKTLAIKSFQYAVTLIKLNFELNRFIVPVNTYFYLQEVNGTLLARTSYFLSESPTCLLNQTDECFCLALSIRECYRLTRIVDFDHDAIIPGMFSTWFPFQSLMMSTLECFYSNSCLSQIIMLIDDTLSPTNFSALVSQSSSSNSTQPFERIESLTNRLFIASWFNESSFESYFNACRPLTCQYSYQSRLSIIYIVTTVIGLVGGLFVAWRLIAPIFVTFGFKIYNYFQSRRSTNDAIVTGQIISRPTSVTDRLYHLRHHFNRLTQQLLELNLFDTIPPSQDPQLNLRNRYITRAYIIAVILALFVILMYTSLKIDVITVTTDSPSLSIYLGIYNRYPSTVKCPCNHVAIKYDEFIIQLEPEYHSLCSSIFVSLRWLESLQIPKSIVANFRYADDFRGIIQMQFLTLARFCNLSQELIQTSLVQFYRTDFVTANVLSPTEFNDQVNALVEQFKRATADEFQQIFKLVLATNHGNQLATVFPSNWDYFPQYESGYVPTDPFELPAVARPITYGIDRCSCGMQVNCSEMAQFTMNLTGQRLTRTLSGFRIGCYPLNALLQSDLSCLYNQSCFDMMRAAMFYAQPISANIFTMDSSLAGPSATIQTLINQLFVLKWFYTSSFENYFATCSPQFCQYSYSMNFNRVYIITTLIALFGGLVKGLHVIFSFLTMIFVKLSFYRKTERHVNQMLRTTTIIQVRSVDRAFLIILSLLIIIVIIAAPYVWYAANRNEDEKRSPIFDPSITSTINNNATTTITLQTNRCYMTFKYSVPVYRTGQNPKSFVVNDLNRDTFQDIAVANDGDQSISIFLNNGDGTFQIPLIYPTGYGINPWGIVSIDFNGDNLTDIVITSAETNELVIFEGVLNSTLFELSADKIVLSPSSSDRLGHLEAMDINEDGSIDLIVFNRGLSDWEGLLPLRIIFNDRRNLRFQVPTQMYLPAYQSLVFGSFDHSNEQKDLVLIGNDSFVLTFTSLNYTDPQPMWSKTTFINRNPQSLIKGRFNHDNTDDLAVIFAEINILQILLGNGDGTFESYSYTIIPYPTSITRLNFNNDSIDDVAILHCNSLVTILLGSSTGIFNQNDPITFNMTDEENKSSCSTALNIADLNGDERNDLLFINEETRRIYTLLSADCDVF